jgi:hypothetical protein
MPQISSTGRLLMAANDTTDALKHPYLDSLFTEIGYDTITALSKLAANFKNKFQRPSGPEIIQAPVKAAENKQPSALAQSILTSPMKHNYITRSQQASPTYPSNVSQSNNSPLLLRVVAPTVRSAAPPRVSARVHNLSPINLSQDHFLDIGNANQAISFYTNHWINIQMDNDSVHQFKGNEMEYTVLMKNPALEPRWKRGFGNEVGRLFQGIRNI